MSGIMRRRCHQGTVKGVRTPRRGHSTRTQLSGLEDVVFKDFIKDDFIPEGDGQVASTSASFLTL